MNEKMKKLEKILTDFDNKLTDFLIVNQLAEVKKQKKQAEILQNITRLISALDYDKLTSCSEEELKFLLADWKKAMVTELYKFRETIK